MRWHTGPCCSCHQQLPAQGEGTHKETHPALQPEMRRRRKCTWCFEFRNLQISILQGIALIHLLSAKGQEDIVHDHHHPLQGPLELASCLLFTLTTTRSQSPGSSQAAAHTSGAPSRVQPVPLGRLRKAQHQARALSGRMRRWQRQGAKPNQGDSWQRGHSDGACRGLRELHGNGGERRRRRRKNTSPTGQGTQSLFSGNQQTGGVSLEDTTGRQHYQG